MHRVVFIPNDTLKAVALLRRGQGTSVWTVVLVGITVVVVWNTHK